MVLVTRILRLRMFGPNQLMKSRKTKEERTAVEEDRLPEEKTFSFLYIPLLKELSERRRDRRNDNCCLEEMTHFRQQPWEHVTEREREDGTTWLGIQNRCRAERDIS